MAKKAGPERRRRRLIIDDHPATSELIADILQQMEGIDSIIVPDGYSGIEKAKSEKPDLILLDIMMPEMSGFQVCHKLKADPETSKIPVIIVSVRTSEDSVKKGKDLGADEYIPKPFDPYKLIEVVKKYL